MISQVKISDFTEVITGGTPSTNVKDYWDGGTIPWLNSGELNKKYIYDSKNFITEAGLKNSSTRLMPADTVLIALTGATCGLSALMKIEACANQSVTGILPSKNHSPDYLLHYLRTQRERILDKAWGNAQPHISQQFVKDMIIPLPPLSTQLHIAGLLSKAESLISQRKESIHLLDEFLKSTFLEMFGDPVRNEKGWKKVISSKILEVRGRVGWKGYKKSDLRQHGPYVLGATHLTSLGDIDLSDPVYISEEKFTESPEIVVQIRDLLIVQRGNTVGKVGLISKEIGKATINPCILILRPKRVNHFFLKYYFLQDKIQSQLWKMNTGSAQPMITQGQLREMEISFPPIELQIQFARIVEKTEALKEQYRESLRELENLYGSLSQRAFRGEVG